MIKIVHSYWSKPFLEQKEKSLGGWPERISHYMSWALSCLKFREFYDRIELVTDREGKRLLIDELGLPYTHVRVVLNELDSYPTCLWALGKLYAYGIQEEPFIHVDGDFYIWKKFPEGIEEASLIALHKEDGYMYDRLFYEDVSTTLNYIPEEIIDFRKEIPDVIEANAGIMGGNDYLFFKEYVRKAFDFVNKNKDNLDQLKYKDQFNSIFEQYLFYCLAWIRQRPVTFLIKEQVPPDFGNQAPFHLLPYKKTFVHAVGPLKNDFFVSEQIAMRLAYEYPSYYEKIVKLVKQKVL